MLPIVATLLAVATLGLMFNSTRWLGVAAVALLTFRYPIPTLMGVAAGFVIFIFTRKHK